MPLNLCAPGAGRDLAELRKLGRDLRISPCVHAEVDVISRNLGNWKEMCGSHCVFPRSDLEGLDVAILRESSAAHCDPNVRFKNGTGHKLLEATLLVVLATI